MPYIFTVVTLLTMAEEIKNSAFDAVIAAQKIEEAQKSEASGKVYSDADSLEVTAGAEPQDNQHLTEVPTSSFSYEHFKKILQNSQDFLTQKHLSEELSDQQKQALGDHYFHFSYDVKKCAPKI